MARCFCGMTSCKPSRTAKLPVGRRERGRKNHPPKRETWRRGRGRKGWSQKLVLPRACPPPALLPARELYFVASRPRQSVLSQGSLGLLVARVLESERGWKPPKKFWRLNPPPKRLGHLRVRQRWRIRGSWIRKMLRTKKPLARPRQRRRQRLRGSQRERQPPRRTHVANTPSMRIHGTVLCFVKRLQTFWYPLRSQWVGRMWMVRPQALRKLYGRALLIWKVNMLTTSIGPELPVA